MNRVVDFRAEDYPHKCSECGLPAFEGPLKVRCVNPTCRHFDTELQIRDEEEPKADSHVETTLSDEAVFGASDKAAGGLTTEEASQIGRLLDKAMGASPK